VSEASDQAEDIRQLTSALFAARAALSDAEKQSKAYAEAVATGTQAIDHAKAVEVEANREIAKAATDAAQAAVRSAAARMAADNSAAGVARKNAAEAKRLADERAAAEKAAASEAMEAWKAANERGRVAEAVTREHTRATKELETSLAGAARAAGSSALGFVRSNVSLAGLGSAAGVAVATVGGVAHILGEATAEAARHERALRLLGPAYNEVERATAGAMSAEQALNLQGEINAAGVRVNAQELGLLTRAAREYALATGNDVTQALAKLSNAIVNNSEDALSELNLSQARSTSSAQTLANMTELLAQRYRGLAPTAQQADERVESFNRAAKEAGATLLSGVARGAESALGALIRLGGGTESATQTLRSFSKEFRDWLNDDPDAMNAASNRALQNITRVREQYEIQRRAFQNSSMLEGSGIQLPSANDLTVRQRDAMVQLFEESSRLTNTDFQQRMRNVLALAEQERAAAQARRAASDLERQVEAINAADRRAHQNDDLGLLRAQAERVGLRVNMQTQSVTAQQRLNFLQRELGRLLQDETRNREAIKTTLGEMVQLRQQQTQAASEGNQRAREQEELRRSGLELREEVEWALRMNVRVAEVERRRFETGAEYIARRIEAQRELNAAVREGMEADDRRAEQDAELVRRKADDVAIAAGERQRAQTEREEDAAAERDRQRAAMNAAAAERERADETQNRLREAFGFAQEQSNTVTQSMASGAKAAYDGFGELGKGIVEATLAATAAGEDVGAAVAQQVDQWATAKAVQWGLQAGESLAGAGLAYFIRPDAVPGLLASAATYAGMAAVAGVTAAVIPNAPAASAGGAGGADRGLGLAASSRATSADAKMQPNIIVNVSGVMSNEQTQHEIARSLRDLRDRGMM
jgi:hypothetical protein